MLIRMGCCPQRTGPGLENRANDYSNLGSIDSVDSVENYGGYGCGRNRKSLSSGYGDNVQNPGQPQGLLAKATGSNPTIENYGGYGCGRNRKSLSSGYGDNVQNPGQPQGLLAKATGSNPTIENYGCGSKDMIEPYTTGGEDCGCG